MSELTNVKNHKEMRKNIFHLAWPAILRMFLQSIVGVVDVIMVGQLGASAIAAVEIGNGTKIPQKTINKPILL